MLLGGVRGQGLEPFRPDRGAPWTTARCVSVHKGLVLHFHSHKIQQYIHQYYLLKAKLPSTYFPFGFIILCFLLNQYLYLNLVMSTVRTTLTGSNSVAPFTHDLQ